MTGGIITARMPVQPRPAFVRPFALQRLNHGSGNTLSTEGGIDKQILQIADRRGNPGSLMKNTAGEYADRNRALLPVIR